jgi:hypothetical protein
MALRRSLSAVERTERDEDLEVLCAIAAAQGLVTSRPDGLWLCE